MLEEKKQTNMRFFKISAYGDTVYVRSETEDTAYERFTKMIGSMPRNLLTFQEIRKVNKPKGEEWL